MTKSDTTPRRADPMPEITAQTKRLTANQADTERDAERAMMLDAKRRYETGDLSAEDRQRLAQIRRDFQGWKGNGYVRT